MTRNSTQTRTRTTRTRRLSSCYRHPSEPVNGICAACLRERLSGIDPSGSQSPTVTTLFKNPNAAEADAYTTSFSPDLRRCRSVSATKCEASSSSFFSEPRRKSCDVRGRNSNSNSNSLENLFGVDDDEVGGSSGTGFIVESKNLGLAKIREQQVRVPAADALLPIADVEDGELKTMKEFIDLEFHSKNHKSKDFRDVAGSFKEAASVFSKKLQNWRQKQRAKKLGNSNGRNDVLSAGNRKLIGRKSRDALSEVGEYTMGRRSCDTEPRFSVDAGRLSIEDQRISIDEPRASWDGYLVARTIPRLTPMLSVVENVLLGNGNRFDNSQLSLDGQMQAIVEDESSSGGSGQSNSDSSSSQWPSSFDRSSSVRSFGKRTLGLEVDEAKSLSNLGVSPANSKLIITERELKDWHLNSIKDDHLNKFESFNQDVIVAETCGTKKGSKKSARWREVFHLFGYKHKLNNNKEETLTRKEEAFRGSVTDTYEMKGGDRGHGDVKDAGRWSLKRNSSIVRARNSCSIEYAPARNSCSSEYVPARKSYSSTYVQPRKSCDMTVLNHSKKSVAENAASTKFGKDAFLLERNKSVKCPSNDLDNSMLPFYLMPLRSSKSHRSSENKLRKPH